jgi:hypothetical protein
MLYATVRSAWQNLVFVPQEALQQDAAAAAQQPMPTLQPGLGGPVAKGINWLMGLFIKKPGELHWRCVGYCGCRTTGSVQD